MDEVCLRAAELIENNYTSGEFFGAALVGEQVKVCSDGALLIESGCTETDTYEYGDQIFQTTDIVRYTPEYKKAAKRLASIIEDCGCAELEHERAYLSSGKHHCHSECICQNYKIHHYSDKHCDGGVMASKKLREAAEVVLPDEE